MTHLPSGTVTFLFTDIEGSTRLWQLFPDAMGAALSRHRAMLTASIERHGGYLVQVIVDWLTLSRSAAAENDRRSYTRTSVRNAPMSTGSRELIVKALPPPRVSRLPA